MEGQSGPQLAGLLQFFSVCMLVRRGKPGPAGHGHGRREQGAP